MYNLRMTVTIVALALLAGAGCKSNSDKAEQSAKSQAPAKSGSAADKAAPKTAPKPDESADKAAEADQPGQWAESKAYGLKFRVPDDWNVVTDEEGVSATDPDGTITVLLAGSKSQKLAKSMLNDMRADLNFKDLELEKTGPSTINGMPVFRGSGTGVLDKEDMDQEIQFLGYTIRRSGDQTATLFIFAQAEMYEAKRDQIKGIANTLVETSSG